MTDTTDITEPTELTEEQLSDMKYDQFTEIHNDSKKLDIIYAKLNKDAKIDESTNEIIAQMKFYGNISTGLAIVGFIINYSKYLKPYLTYVLNIFKL